MWRIIPLDLHKFIENLKEKIKTLKKLYEEGKGWSIKKT